MNYFYTRNLLAYLNDDTDFNAIWQPINFGNVQKNMVVSKPNLPEASSIKDDPVLLLYPNPTQNEVTIQYTLTNPKGNTHVSIYDLMGRKLKTEMMPKAQGSVMFSTVDMPNGMYLVVLSDENGRHKTGKLMVRH